jgi:hypothetical protein
VDEDSDPYDYMMGRQQMVVVELPDGRRLQAGSFT